MVGGISFIHPALPERPDFFVAGFIPIFHFLCTTVAGAIRARLTPRLPAERLLLIAIALGKMLYEERDYSRGGRPARIELFEWRRTAAVRAGQGFVTGSKGAVGTGPSGR